MIEDLDEIDHMLVVVFSRKLERVRACLCVFVYVFVCVFVCVCVCV